MDVSECKTIDEAIEARKTAAVADVPSRRPAEPSRFGSAIWVGGRCLGVWPENIVPGRRVRLDGRDYIARPHNAKPTEHVPSRGGWQTVRPVELLPAKPEDEVLVINIKPE